MLEFFDSPKTQTPQILTWFPVFFPNKTTNTQTNQTNVVVVVGVVVGVVGVVVVVVVVVVTPWLVVFLLGVVVVCLFVCCPISKRWSSAPEGRRVRDVLYRLPMDCLFDYGLID